MHKGTSSRLGLDAWVHSWEGVRHPRSPNLAVALHSYYYWILANIDIYFVNPYHAETMYIKAISTQARDIIGR